VIRIVPAVLGLALLVAGTAAPQDPPIPADTEVKTTPSGLKYSVLKAGDPKGVHPRLGDDVTVHYTGWLTDGKVFDSSKTRGNPLTFKLGRVIPGWNEGLQLMTPGAKFKFTIPADLAYGKSGQRDIPPDSTLIFEVELLKVKRGVAPPDFKTIDPKKLKTTPSGLKYHVLKEGKGKAPEPKEGFELKYAMWTREGQLVFCTELSDGHTLKGKADNMRVKFLQEAPFLMKPGARYWFEVPPKLGMPASPRSPVPPNASTIWELELVRVIRPLPVPEFSPVSADKMQTTKSGLKYEVIREGTGKQAKEGDPVTVHYAGWLTDGKNFDSSFSRGEPTTFALSPRSLILGWVEGIQLMKEGAIYKFSIPSYLAYGTRGNPPVIQPNQELVFHIELIKVGE